MNKKQQIERDFEQLVERQRQTIYSVCYLFADERQQADDLFQETLIRLWQGFDTFEGRSTEKTWVYRIAREDLGVPHRVEHMHQHGPQTPPAQGHLSLRAERGLLCRCLLLGQQ